MTAAERAIAPELTMFSYPWDLYLDGVQESVQLVRDLGCHRLAVAVAYHSAEIISPRRHRSVQVSPEANVSHLALPATFTEIALPTGRLARHHPELAAQLADAARLSGLGLTAWIVVCHNSDLAQRYPAAALENCFGDRSAHGLCPSNPLVGQYMSQLCLGVLDMGLFDELFVESVAYLLSGHGHPHELWGVRDDPASRYLRSLCFCASCLALGTQRGVDGDALRRWVAATLHRTWNSPLALVRGLDPGDELAGLLVSRPDLHEWTSMRCARVTELTKQLADLAHAHGVRLSSGLGVFARPAPLGWMEGIDPGAVAGLADRLVAMAYYPGPQEVARDLDHYLALMPADRIQLVQALWPAHHGDVETLLGKFRLAKSVGVRSFGLYNLATAPAPALDWARAVAAALAG